MKKQLTAALLAALCLLLPGCSGASSSASATASADEAQTQTIYAMDTVMDLKAYGGSASAALTAAADTITRLESVFSVTDENSEVYAINQNGGEESVSQPVADLLTLGLKIGKQTDGAFELSIYPVVRAWGFTTGSYQVPTNDELQSLLTKVDDAAIEFDGTKLTLPAGMELDFGAIAKGYAGDQAIEAMREAGASSAILNLGGNVQTLGLKPDGSNWNVAIKNPKDPESENYLGILSVGETAVITSGGYERYFTQDGVTYHHIIDPATGYPADSGLTSVTIVGEDGGVCDGLSTSLFVMGKDKALDYWRTYGGFQCVLVTEDGEVVVTEGLKDAFTLVDETDYTVTVAAEAGT